MSIRIKLALLLSTIVGFTLFVAWWITGRTIIQPFTREVMETYLDEVVFIAGEIDRGKDAAELSTSLNLEIHISPQPPPFFTKRNARFDLRCQKEERGGYQITHCRGRRAPVVVEAKKGFIIVRRDLDVTSPGRRIGQLLLFIAGAVILFSALVATLITKPLKTTRLAMDQVARGDLSHRLPVAGGHELAEVARAFNGMADRVETLLRTERELMAGISHELRTPLARMRLQLELLRDLGAVPEKRLGAMEKDLEEVDLLIGELLECSRLSLGERTLERAGVDLERVVEEAIARNPLPSHEVAVKAESPRSITGDHARLVRAVGNLIQNAGKYAPESTKVEITIRGTEIEVLDHGPGVPSEELHRLFEPFFRGVNARSTANGLGLGLMIARQVVTLHGGTIEAANRPEGGLAIRILFPAASA